MIPDLHSPLLATASLRLRSARRLGAALCLLALAALPGAAQSAEELIPFEKLPVALRKELWRVAKKHTVRRRLPERSVACEEATFHYLLRRLPLASRLVRHLKLGRYKITGAEDGSFHIDDDAGAAARCEIVHRDAHRLVIVARGHVDPTILPKVLGTGIIVVRTSQAEDSTKGIQADCRVYFRVADRSLHMISRPFRKQLGRVIEKRLGLFVDCAVTIAALVAKNPKRVLAALAELDESPELQKDFAARFTSGR